MVFQKAIAKADPGETLNQRVINLIDCITYSVFQYTSRGLFECDKLIFASQMTFQVIFLFFNHTHKINSIKILTFLDSSYE